MCMREVAMPWKRALAGGAAGTAAALAGGAAGTAAALAGLMLRYAAGVARADRSWPVQVEPGLRDLGEVDEVSILPLVERHTVAGRGLIGELVVIGRSAGGARSAGCS